MKKLQLEINGKTYTLKFGYGCFRILAEKRGMRTIDELFVFLSNITTGEMEFCIDLIWAAGVAGGDDIDTDDIGDLLLFDRGKMEEVMAFFLDSLPKEKQDDAGKQMKAPELPVLSSENP